MAASPRIQFAEEELIKLNVTLWRVILGLTVAVLVLAIVVWLLMSRSQPLPYVVAVNERGEPIGLANPVFGPQSLNDTVVEWALARFIDDARSVSTSIPVTKASLNRAYAFARGQAYKALNDYYLTGDDHHPMHIAQAGRKWIEVEISRRMKLPQENAYEIDWREITHQVAGGEPAVALWRATLTIATTTPKRDDPDNPIGLYITTLDWEKEPSQ